jgi:hypothetical protein
MHVVQFTDAEQTLAASLRGRYGHEFSFVTCCIVIRKAAVSIRTL